MPNSLNFEVQFTRKQLENLLSNPDTQKIIVSGTYTHDPTNPAKVWDMKATAKAASATMSMAKDGDGDEGEGGGDEEDGCIQPCPDNG